ncbi:MAG: NCS2 family permease [Longicatena sp.]
MLEKLFKLKAKQTSVKTEVIAGLTTFLAMAYILGVNPVILGDAGMDIPSVFMATAISAGFASILMGLIANYPVALAAGMGVNALFAYTICGQMGFSWQAALAGVFVSGIIFVVISVTGIRKVIINAIPKQLKMAIGAGIGFFIAFVGLKNAGIIAGSDATFVTLGNLGEPTILLAVFGILLTIYLVIKKVPAAVFVGMVITAVIGMICGMAFGMKGMPTMPANIFEMQFDMKTVGSFMDGFGTLVAVASRIGLVNEKGELENVERALLADAVGTVAGAALGTSTVTSFVESTSGVEVGGKTGLTACTTGVLFFISILFAPLVLSAVTNAVTAPALVVVGILMAQQLKEIDWDDMVFATAGFVTVVAMILTYSISNGIAFGFIAYTVAMIAAGKTKEIHVTVWILMVIFVIYFALPQIM